MSSDMSHFCCLVFFIVFVVAILGILLWDFSSSFFFLKDVSSRGLVSSFTLQEGMMRHVCAVEPRGKLPGIYKHFFKPVSRAEFAVEAASTANFRSFTFI